MKKIFCILGIALVMGFAFTAKTNAQVVGPSGYPTVTQTLDLKVDGSALIAVVNSNASATSTGVAISLTGATVAGDEVTTTASNSDTRIRVSSQVEDGKTRTLKASISPAITGSGTQLFITVTNPNNFAPASANSGTVASGEQELTDGSERTLVTGIKTCWSGTNATSGYQITYRYAKAAAATALVSKTVTITYTISDQS